MRYNIFTTKKFRCDLYSMITILSNNLPCHLVLSLSPLCAFSINVIIMNYCSDIQYTPLENCLTTNLFHIYLMCCTVTKYYVET